MKDMLEEFVLFMAFSLYATLVIFIASHLEYMIQYGIVFVLAGILSVGLGCIMGYNTFMRLLIISRNKQYPIRGKHCE